MEKKWINVNSFFLSTSPEVYTFMACGRITIDEKLKDKFESLNINTL